MFQDLEDNHAEIVEIWEEDVEIEGNDEPMINNHLKERKIISVTVQAIFFLQTSLFLSDSCVEKLLGLIRLFLFLLINIMTITVLEHLYELFPATMYTARKSISINPDNFEKYVVCTSCNMLYRNDDCFYASKNGTLESRTCSFIAYPNHPHKSRRGKCGNLLMKSIMTCNRNKVNLYPIKTYPYKSIQESLEELLQKPGFMDLLFSDIPTHDNRFCDVTDGNIWKTFKDNDGHLFCKDKRNLGLFLNMDWFNPYENSEYSLGVIYITILNIPREHRFLWENTIVVSIIPGPKEPSLTVNTYLKPMVDELLEFWNGKVLCEPGTVGSAIYKLAIMGISNDIPATRKFGGFLNFNAKKGKNKSGLYFLGKI